MNVVHLATTDIGGGAAKAAFRIHQGLRSLGVDSTMQVALKLSQDRYVQGRQGPWHRKGLGLLRRLDDLPRRLLVSENHSLISPAWVDSFSVDWAALDRADLVQIHWICGGFLRLENLARLKRPVVWRLADMWPLAGGEHYTQGCTRYIDGYVADNRPPGEKGLDLNRWVWERKLRTYARIRDLTIVAPSGWMADCARRSRLFRGREVVIIPTGQDMQRFRPLEADERRRLRAKWGLPVDKNLLLFGAMNATSDRRKGYAHLCAALESLAQSEAAGSFALVVFGGRKQPSTRLLDLPVFHLGSLEESGALAQVYGSCDVFVAPSREENLANTVIEAMACGTPTVAFAVGGMPDAIDHGRTGYLAPPFDEQQLAAGIRLMFRDPALREQWSRAARKAVEHDFSSRLQAERYRALYRDIARRYNLS